MEFVNDSSTPEWVNDLAAVLEADGKVGLFAYRNNMIKRIDLSPAVYIGCSYRGNSSNYSTTLSEMLYSMSSSSKGVSTIPYSIEKSANVRRVIPGYIVSKYYAHFATMSMYVSNRTVLAMCDTNSREMYIPDITSEIEWSENKDGVVEDIAGLVSDIVEMMIGNSSDSLLRDIKSAGKANTHVELLEVKAETSFDKNGFIKECMDAMSSYEKSIDDSYNSLFSNMQKDLRTAQGQGIADALDLMAYLKTKHFVFVSSDVIRYTGGKITANTAIYRDSIYKTTEEMWISGMKLHICDGVVVDASCYRAHHPNCSGRHVCIGELIGTPIREVDKVVEAMKVPNFSNGYWRHSDEYFGDKVIDLEGSSESIWSSDE